MIRPSPLKMGLLPTAFRLVGVAACALTLSGCISLLPKTKPVQLYRLAPPAAAAAPTMPGPSAVAVFRSNGAFQEEASDDRLLTVVGGKAAYIGQTRWVAPAETLFNQAVTTAFDASPIRLISRGQQGRYGYTLRMDVRNFEARYDHGAKAAPTVVVHIHAALTKADQTSVGEQEFEARAEAGDNRVGPIVAAFSKATNEAIGKVVAWTEANATQPVT